MCITIHEIHAALTQGSGNSIDYNGLMKLGLANYLKWLHTSFLKYELKKEELPDFSILCIYEIMLLQLLFITSEDRILQVIFLAQTGYTRAEYFLFNLLQKFTGEEGRFESRKLPVKVLLISYTL